MFDLETLRIFSPVKIVKQYEYGKYISYRHNNSVRFRGKQVPCKNHDNSALASNHICNPGRWGVGQTPKFDKWIKAYRNDEMIKRKKSVRAHKLPRVFVRWPSGPRTKAVRVAKGNRGSTTILLCEAI